MYYIVLDLEFNQSYPFKNGSVVPPLPQCPFEIIQIGAVKLNEAFEIIEEFDAFIKPEIYPRLHPYVEKITGIKADQLADKASFKSVYADFTNFIGTKDAILCTWGNDDIKALFRNILHHKLDPDQITQKYINVQTHASTFLKHEKGKAIGLKNATVELEIETDIPFHNALCDAIYTAKVFALVHPEEITPSHFRPLTLLVNTTKAPKTNTPALLQHVSDVMERELTAEERKLIKMAYVLGRAHAFDASVVKRKK
ncbi:3'-5' exonuclease [Chakrabartyella piscis]|uniref:3'-5' exonuclease n=1 Tax=Chakrabartyella piscis TaxID=2918914 RepID=UPI0029585919|nr:3'-5' exonuclease [Chakrabartyella piscis]